MALAGEAKAKNRNEWIMSGKTCRLQGFHTYAGKNLKTGQAAIECLLQCT